MEHFADTPLFTCSQLSSDSPQLSVQCLNHGRKAPAGLIQIYVAGPQAVAHRLLAGETKKGCLSVETHGSEGATGSGGLLQAPVPAPPPALQDGPRGRGAAASRRHRERALQHGQRGRTFAAGSGHAKTLTGRVRACS